MSIRPVYVSECGCRTTPAMPQTVHHVDNDSEAAALFAAAMLRYHNAGAQNGPRYWTVHGPGGHVIAVQRS